MKTAWRKIKVCNRCKSTKIIGCFHCGDCGKEGYQAVLMRYDISLFGIKKEYKKYSNYVNPFDQNEGVDING